MSTLHWLKILSAAVFMTGNKASGLVLQTLVSIVAIFLELKGRSDTVV